MLSRRTFGWIVAMFIILAFAGLFLFYIRIFFGEPQYTVRTDGAVVISELKKLNRLETASLTLEKIIEAGTHGNAFQEFLYGDRILMIANGDVVAGIDLSELRNDDITVSDKSVTLSLPAPSIFSITLNNEQTRVFDRKTGIFTKGDRDLESEARRTAEDIMRSAACDSGILDDASENAKRELGALLGALGFDSVNISIPGRVCTSESS